MILLLSVLQLVPLFSIFALVNATDSFDDEITFFPTHPALDYLPRSDCVHRFLGKWCRGRNYAWQTYDYLDEQSGIYHRHKRAQQRLRKWPSRNLVQATARLVLSLYTRYILKMIFCLLAARDVRLYGAPPSQTVGHEMAAQELCIGYRPCIQLDVQDAYRRASNDHDPVLFWAGDLPDVLPWHSVSLTLRMVERTHRKGQTPKLMTLERVTSAGQYDTPMHR